MRPDLDGEPDHGRSSASRPGRDVGQAYTFLLERRIDDGPLGAERAREELLAWWGEQSAVDESARDRGLGR